MFAQTLVEALTLNEIIFLKKQIWWTGCTETPFVCRGGVYQKNSYILVITDSRSVWVTKADQQQINEEKDKFNQSIKIKFEDILKTLDTPLRFGRSNTQFTRMQFRKNKDEDLIFVMEFGVGIYPFKWEFFLTKMDDNEIFNILVDDLINPMAKSIISLEERGNAYRKKCIQIENELMKRLTEKERATYYTNVDSDNEQFLSRFLKDDTIDNKLIDFDYGPAAKYYLSHYNSINILQVEGNKQANEPNNDNNEDKHDNSKKMKIVQDYFNTLDEQPFAGSSLRPDSKKRYQKSGNEEQIPQLKLLPQKLDIKVNYEELDEVSSQQQQQQNLLLNKQDNKKKKKRLDFL